MPANLPPQYHKVELEYRQAPTAGERLEKLREMYRLLPKHKGTEKLQAELKQKISRAKDEQDSGKSAGKKSGLSYRVPSEGAGQVVLLGAPNAGKSALVRAVSHAHPEVAAYPFTTRAPIPGMACWQDASYQLVDLPPISQDFFEPWMNGLIRSADAALLVVDLSDDDALEAAETVEKRLSASHIELVRELPHDSGEEQCHLRTAVVATKRDAAGAGDRLEIVREWFEPRLGVLAVSAETGEGLESLVKQAYDLLEVIRIYTKVPGKPVDRSHPFTIPLGSTVADLAVAIHRDLGDTLKYARIWGTGVYEGQTVKRDHSLHDGDVVELHT